MKIPNLIDTFVRKQRTFYFLIAFLAGNVAFGQSITTTNPAAWDASAAVGFTLTRGNSETLLFTGNIQAAKKWNKNEVNLGVDGVYGENDGDESAESVRGFGQFNRLFTERAFGYIRFEALHDGIANIDYRLTVSAGAGYYFIKTTNTTLRAEVGPGYIYERNGDATVNGVFFPAHSHDYITLRIAE